MLLLTAHHSLPFQGWLFDDDGFLLDPAGNRYLPADLQASHWMRQAWAARAGSPGELCFLRSALVRERELLHRPILISASRILSSGIQVPLGVISLSPWLSPPHCLAVVGEGVSPPLQAALAAA